MFKNIQNIHNKLENVLEDLPEYFSQMHWKTTDEHICELKFNKNEVAEKQ